ncbi:hypothetical protein M0805_006481 [Coniferiporia weirii]|nr:hypothetical protein M0805_006481 [Coniferiporia weirii]
MFGESESESPRTGSPWDGFLSNPRVVPKLVPEVEEGNVEYKLRLLSPPPERFARLVTQLKWRLLEGGGQAYYELGVADSGALVVLSRAHLEMSLMTLEEVAGEIGASVVVVVKEIELPAALVGDDEGEGGKGRIADGAMRMPKRRVEECVDRGSPEGVSGSTPTDAEYKTELSTPEAEDEPDKDGEDESAWLPCRRTYAHANGRRARLSPTDSESCNSASSDDCEVFAGDLEIASVYKPRPHRRRTPASVPPLATTATVVEYGHPAPVSSAPVDVPAPLLGVRGGTGRSRKEHGREHAVATRALDELEAAAAAFVGLSIDGEDSSGSGSGAAGDDSPVCAPVPQVAVSGAPADGLQVRHTESGYGYGGGSSQERGREHRQERDAGLRGSDLMYKGRLVPDDARLRRYIVEALVVRKMALDEVFPDLVNF